MDRFRSLHRFARAKHLVIVTLLCGLVGAHIYVTPATTGPLLVLDHLYDIMLVLALLAICASVGGRLLTRCDVAVEQPIEALLFSIAIGAGALATTILICGLLSCLKALTLGLILLSLALLTRKELARLPGSMAQCFTHLGARGNTLSLLLFGAVALFMLLMAIAPPLEWDALMYHLRVPAQFLKQGRIYLPEDNLYTAHVGLVHMLYIPLLAFGSQTGPALLSMFFALALALAVFQFCRQFLSDGAAGLALCSLWGSTVVLLPAITPRVDVTLAFFLFLAHYALLKTLFGSHGQRVFYLSACLLGLAIGIKYPAIIYIVALVPLIVRVAWCRPGHFLRTARNLALFSILCVVAALPWFAKNWLLLGSPLYPFFANARIEPWLAALYPNPGDAFPIINETVNWPTLISAPFSILALIRTPGALSVEAEGALYYPSAILVLLPLWVVLIRRNQILNWLMLPAVGYSVMLTLVWPHSVIRYLIPVLPPFTIVSVEIAVRAWQRLFPSRSVIGLSALIFGITLLPVGIIVKAYLVKTNVLAHAIGNSSVENYLMKRGRGYAHMISYANRNLTKEARVLLIFEARGYYFDIPVIQDSVLTNWPLVARSGAVGNCLRGTGISHLLVNRVALQHYLRRGMDPQLVQWDALQEFARRCLTIAYDAPGLTLYRVKE